MSFVPYTTIEGDRWDNLAYRAYGDAVSYKIITDANPLVPLYDILPGGLDLQIPVIDTPQTSLDKSLLPPWKQ